MTPADLGQLLAAGLAVGQRPGALVWPLLFGLGLYLLATAQPLGRPRPDLAARLRRLDVDERVRDGLARVEARPVFVSRALERLLRPVLDDAGRALQGALGRLGLLGLGGASQETLARRLRLARPGVEPSQFFGEKAAAGAIGLALLPLMNAVGVHPFGPWPLWLWAVAGAAGFVLPDYDLERRAAARRAAAVRELPAVLDLLTIAVSAGLALEQALDAVARRGRGIVASELRVVTRELALGRHTLAEALDAAAARNDLPELTAVVGQLRAAHEQGIPLAHTLSTQAESLRERKRLWILEEGGKAGVRMLLPVACFILPVLFVVLLFPAAVQLMHLGG